MSVNTYLKRKNVSAGYQVLQQGDVKILVSFGLARWAKSVYVDSGRFLFWRRFLIEAEPKHEARPRRHLTPLSKTHRVRCARSGAVGACN